ncbi:MAG: hypothetical protein K6U03_04010 [Firmicutes bacterium]|nr:hypothetical protein [Bacillota bacterium]
MKPTRARFFALSLLLATGITASAGGPKLEIDPPALDLITTVISGKRRGGGGYKNNK